MNKIGMSKDEKVIYKKLRRQVGESWSSWEKTRLNKYARQFNNRLKRMKEFLRGLKVDYSKNRFFDMEEIEIKIETVSVSVAGHSVKV